MDVPEVHYARNGDIAIAYQVFGQGPLDLVYVPGWVSHVEAAWDLPEMRSFLERLGSFARVIAMDRRGVGLSDRLSADDLPALETQMDDLRVVMEAAGSSRAALLGFLDGVGSARSSPPRTPNWCPPSCYTRCSPPAERTCSPSDGAPSNGTTSWSTSG